MPRILCVLLDGGRVSGAELRAAVCSQVLDDGRLVGGRLAVLLSDPIFCATCFGIRVKLQRSLPLRTWHTPWPFGWVTCCRLSSHRTLHGLMVGLHMLSALTVRLHFAVVSAFSDFAHFMALWLGYMLSALTVRLFLLPRFPVSFCRFPLELIPP